MMRMKRAFAVARVEMFSQAARFLFVSAKQFHHGAGRIHSTGSVNSRADAKAEIVGGHLAVIATSGDIDQRSRTGIPRAR